MNHLHYYPDTGDVRLQNPEPVCTCKSENVTFCEVCQEYSDCCLSCLPEPLCECVYVREDVTDAADCQLHDPYSHYNDLLRAAERRRKAAAAREAFFDGLWNRRFDQWKVA